MLRAFKKKKKREKLNLIPIMDAVFIFIFFLLMSAQFIDIYEINSDAPAVVTVNKKIDKKKPLNLILEIKKNIIIIKTGLNESTHQRLRKGSDGKYDLAKLTEMLTVIKLKNISEESVILRPISSVPYADIIRIMDATRETKDSKILTAKNKKGELVNTSSLFNQIIFETII